MIKRLNRWYYTLAWGLFFSLQAWASADNPQNLGDVAVRVRGNFLPIGKLMIATAYIAGIGFGIAAVYKFKQYRDNPTQIPIGTPFALMVVSICLVFLPGIMDPVGNSIFGDASGAAGFNATNVNKCLPGAC